ncbi:hypothetical protein [uncultured Clostridium sp.]|jgi:flagellar motor switch protein FliG|uniref:hypothetical protein n=1 Tax=uncultured Clostridium sp. TaxID=59620 RepID=UPI00260B7497|nr:hypothetical protein [uncultured Clostridium sp.]
MSGEELKMKIGKIKELESELKEKSLEELENEMEDLKEGLDEYAKANTDKSFPDFYGC